ncbi:respiratory nitrate reductase subunit gamma [Actinomyces faecalis]|uniref:respiratory nitrate reductase subunit gamma n=1 Tax=Actinomyces faecalis TaxID=2722820 RepID=UPI001556AD48|nr:respiratory nitrate reductase subunit gamma [Actinomyces faecalis]
MSTFESAVLWTALPYVCLILLVVGLVWRYRTDQLGWTSRSSQWNESAILRWASPLFHVGILLVGAGHVMGLLVPKSWTEAAGVPEHVYHLAAVIPGTIAGLMTVVGLAGLLYRRLVVKSVRLATTTNDKVMYLLLSVPILLGAWATVSTQLTGGLHGGYDYRETISPWFRSIFTLQPDPSLMAQVPAVFKAHIVAGFLLFAIWPFTRLVHVVSAPVGYVTRPDVVYRSRSAAPTASAHRHGWHPVVTQGTGNQGEDDAAPSQGA